MELKKSEKANLESKRNLFTEVGFVIALSFVLIAFEWNSSEGTAGDLGELKVEQLNEEIIPITRQEQPITAPPPPAQIAEVLNIVENNTEIENELDIQSTDADQNTQIEIKEVAQVEEEEDEVFNFYVLEDKPTFPGGDAALLQWIGSNTKYPEIAKENGITGKVFVGFVIGKDGKVTDVKILRGVDPYLDKEAIRVVSQMPAWAPGKQRGKSVKVSFQVPINFKLQ